MMKYVRAPVSGRCLHANIVIVLSAWLTIVHGNSQLGEALPNLNDPLDISVGDQPASSKVDLANPVRLFESSLEDLDTPASLLQSSERSEESPDAQSNSCTYVAAALQFTTLHLGDAEKRNLNSARLAAQQHLYRNVVALLKYILDAKKAGVDLIVLPEATLWSPGLGGRLLNPTERRKRMRLFGEQVPSNGTVPCDDLRDHSQTEEFLPSFHFSCAARESNITVVANMLDVVPCTNDCNIDDVEGNAFWNYNALVVFDATGRIVVKYYKQHLYGELPVIDQASHDNPPGMFELPLHNCSQATVRIGVMICADLYYRNPWGSETLTQHNVSHLVIAAAWASNPPLYTFSTLLHGFAHSHNVTMIAANGGKWYMNGAGIFAKDDILTQIHNDNLNIDELLIATIPVDTHRRSAATSGADKAAAAQTLTSVPEPQQAALEADVAAERVDTVGHATAATHGADKAFAVIRGLSYPSKSAPNYFRAQRSVKVATSDAGKVVAAQTLAPVHVKLATDNQTSEAQKTASGTAVAEERVNAAAGIDHATAFLCRKNHTDLFHLDNNTASVDQRNSVVRLQVPEPLVAVGPEATASRQPRRKMTRCLAGYGGFEIVDGPCDAISVEDDGTTTTQTSIHLQVTSDDGTVKCDAVVYTHGHDKVKNAFQLIAVNQTVTPDSTPDPYQITGCLLLPCVGIITSGIDSCTGSTFGYWPAHPLFTNISLLSRIQRPRNGSMHNVSMRPVAAGISKVEKGKENEIYPIVSSIKTQFESEACDDNDESDTYIMHQLDVSNSTLVMAGLYGLQHVSD